MIKKSGGSYYLYSQDGSKKLGGPYSSRGEAEHREKQVTYFKNKAAGDPVPTGKSNARGQAGLKVAQSEAHYTNGPVSNQPCSACYMFQSPRACSTVSGNISPSGHCAYYQEREQEPMSYDKAKSNVRTGTAGRVDYIGVQAFSTPKANDGFRTETLYGRNYLVVPVTALVEGVIQGVTANAPELALCSEFGKFPQGWNGRPVVFDHPEVIVDNQAFKVSANSPQVLEKYQFGFLFNSKVEGNALKTEAWIDTHRAMNLNDGTRWVLDRLKTMGAGDSLEVSTGLFTGTELYNGKWNGKDFSAVWSGVVPDHLAFLPEGALGACSVADGCGAGYQTLRANVIGGPEGCSCGGEDPPRDNTSDSAEGAGRGSSPDDPGLKELDPKIEPPEATSDYFLDAISEPYEPDPQDVGPAEKRPMTTTGQDSDYNSGSMVSWMDEIEEGEDADGVIERDPTDATYPKDVKKAKKLKYSPTGIGGSFGIMQQIDQILEAEEFSLFDNAASSADNLETNAMNAQEARKFLANFGHTEAALKSMEDPKVLDLARGVANKIRQYAKLTGGKYTKKRSGDLMDEDNTDIETNPDDDMTGKKAAGGKGEQEAPSATLERHPQATLDELLAQASPDLRESIESGVRMHAVRKDQLIHSLLKTNRCQFKAQELKSFSIAFLENLAQLAAVPQDYSGLNIGRQPRIQRQSTGFAPKPPSLVLLKGSKNGNGNGNGKNKNSTTGTDDDEDDDFPHTYASKSAYEAGGPGYNGNSDGEGEGDYDGTGADSDGVDVKKTKKRAVSSD